MDRVRLGRVLGRGARMAARTVVDAVDAATTPPPATQQISAVRSPVSNPQVTPRTTARAVPVSRETVAQAVRTAGRVHESAQAARRGVLDPVKRASRAVTLEITGSFFALFALSFSVAAWKYRAPAAGGNGQRIWMYLGLALLFAYFACSSFLRARRVSRA